MTVSSRVTDVPAFIRTMWAYLVEERKTGLHYSLDVVVDDPRDQWVVTLHAISGYGLTAWYRNASDRIDGRAAHVAIRHADKDAVVSMMRSVLRGLMLAIHDNDGSLERLTRQALMDDAAVDVLADTLLEGGALAPPERPTDVSDAQAESIGRNDLRRRALAWAQTVQMNRP